MECKIFTMVFLFLCKGIFAQGFVGINTSTPEAALDIKTAQAGHEVMRVSTIPLTVVDKNQPFILLAGEAENNGYNVRQLSVSDFFNLIKREIPSLRRIILTNTRDYTFPMQAERSYYDNNKEIPLKTLVSNTDESLFRLDSTDGSVEILETGFYDVTSWIGVKSIPSAANEFILSLGRKKSGEHVYTNFKRAVVSRTNNGIVYNHTIKEGIGASFSFVDKFEKGDKIITRINSNYANFTVGAKGATLTVSRVDKTTPSLIQ